MRFGKESDTGGCRSFLCWKHKHHSPWKTNAINSGVRGRASMKPLGFFGNSFALTHGIRATNHDGIGVRDDAVTDCVSQCRFTDLLMSATDFELRAVQDFLTSEFLCSWSFRDPP